MSSKYISKMVGGEREECFVLVSFGSCVLLLE